jgi:hypothetical protein
LVGCCRGGGGPLAKQAVRLFGKILHVEAEELRPGFPAFLEDFPEVGLHVFRLDSQKVAHPRNL